MATDKPGWMARQGRLVEHEMQRALITLACRPFFVHEDCERGDSGCECSCHKKGEADAG